MGFFLQLPGFDFPAPPLQSLTQDISQLMEVHRSHKELVNPSSLSLLPKNATARTGEPQEHQVGVQAVELGHQKRSLVGGAGDGVEVYDNGFEGSLLQQGDDLCPGVEQSGMEGGSQELLDVGQGGLIAGQDNDPGCCPQRGCVQSHQGHPPRVPKGSEGSPL
jgi:hypothetical protein